MLGIVKWFLVVLIAVWGFVFFLEMVKNTGESKKALIVIMFVLFLTAICLLVIRFL